MMSRNEHKIDITATDKPQQMLCNNTHWMQCTKIQDVQTTTTKLMQNGMAHKTNITYNGKADTENDASTHTKTCVTINSCDKHSNKYHRHNLGGGKSPPPIFFIPKNFFWPLSWRRHTKKQGRKGVCIYIKDRLKSIFPLFLTWLLISMVYFAPPHPTSTRNDINQVMPMTKVVVADIQ